MQFNACYTVYDISMNCHSMLLNWGLLVKKNALDSGPKGASWRLEMVTGLWEHDAEENDVLIGPFHI